MRILIFYFNKLLNNKSLFFELYYLLFLKHVNKIYIYIINKFFNNIN